MKILVVDDEKDIRDYLKTTLESASFAVDLAHDGAQALSLTKIHDYDLIILDNVMPKKSGLEVCQEIRNAGKHTPILMLSVRSGTDEKVLHLDCGADDYLSKPFSQKELLSRIRAIIRRGPYVEPLTYKSGTLTLNPQTQEVVRNKSSIHLTRKEFALLELLMKYKGSIVSREKIVDHVWNTEHDPFSKTVETHVVNLRKKIDTKREKLIETISGSGYIIHSE